MLRRSSGGIGAFVLLFSRGPMSLQPQPQGSRVHQVRPCERNDPQNAANWNQRAYSSPVSSLFVIEAADVRAPVRADAERVVDADGDLRLERLPRRLGVARPDPAAPLRDARIAVALQAPRPHVRLRRQRALVIELMALDALEQVEPVAFVGPERVDAGVDERRRAAASRSGCATRRRSRPAAAESCRAASAACRDPTAPCARRPSRDARACRRAPPSGRA